MGLPGPHHTHPSKLYELSEPPEGISSQGNRDPLPWPPLCAGPRDTRLNAAGIGPGPGLAAWEGAEKRSPEGKLSGRTGSWPGRALKAEKGQDSAAAGRPQPRRLYKWRQPVRAGCPGGGDQVAGVSGAGPRVGSSRRTQVGWGLGGGSSLESDVRAPGARSSAPPPATPGAWETVGRLRRSGARSPRPPPQGRAGEAGHGAESCLGFATPRPRPSAPRPQCLCSRHRQGAVAPRPPCSPPDPESRPLGSPSAQPYGFGAPLNQLLGAPDPGLRQSWRLGSILQMRKPGQGEGSCPKSGS